MKRARITAVIAVIAVSAVLMATGIAASASDSESDNSVKMRSVMTDEQKTEMQAKMEERLAQCLEEGKITQEQYDAIINGEMSGFGMRGFGYKASDSGEDNREFKNKMPEMTNGQRTEAQTKTKIRFG